MRIRRSHRGPARPCSELPYWKSEARGWWRTQRFTGSSHFERHGELSLCCVLLLTSGDLGHRPCAFDQRSDFRKMPFLGTDGETVWPGRSGASSGSMVPGGKVVRTLILLADQMQPTILAGLTRQSVCLPQVVGFTQNYRELLRTGSCLGRDRGRSYQAISESLYRPSYVTCSWSDHCGMPCRTQCMH